MSDFYGQAEGAAGELNGRAKAQPRPREETNAVMWYKQIISGAC
jgi:hypothetical protein